MASNTLFEDPEMEVSEADTFPGEERFLIIVCVAASCVLCCFCCTKGDRQDYRWVAICNWTYDWICCCFSGGISGGGSGGGESGTVEMSRKGFSTGNPPGGGPMAY